MKKIFKFSCFFLVAVLIIAAGISQTATAAAGPQVTPSVVGVCPINGAQHMGQTKLFSHVYWNSQMYNGHLYTCACGSEVVCFDANRYFYPNGVAMDHSPGFPVIGQEWYLPTTTYSGSPSTWYNVH